jgi:hypothetical protein
VTQKPGVSWIGDASYITGPPDIRSMGTGNWSRDTDFQSHRLRFRSRQTDSWTTPGAVSNPSPQGHEAWTFGFAAEVTARILAHPETECSVNLLIRNE